jgi:hypothetical protein
MPLPTQTSVNVSNGDTVRATDHNGGVTDISALFGLQFPATATVTYVSGNRRKLAQVTYGTIKWVVNWSTSLASTITSIQYYNPATTLVCTWTPTYSGRNIATWTPS